MLNMSVIIPKKDLIHLGIYEGDCRNSSIAEWNSISQQFSYSRSKFGNTFIDFISHIEDCDTCEDGFIPYKLIEPEKG